MIVAQVGCLHGEMDKMYDKLREWEHSNSKEIDVVLCCGDFQSLRDDGDLDALKCPAKFKRLGGFARYFSREKRAPYLTIFIGGNHEASNLLRDLYYGGYVAENIYFLGYSSILNVTKGAHSLRIGGVSGIEKSHDARRGYFEEWPYVHREKNLTSMYHIRDFEIAKLTSIGTPVDFMLSHEWPTVATSHRSYQQDQGFQQLLRYKPYFKQEIQRGELGSPMLSNLLERVPPRVLWCSAHLHCQYRIRVPLADGKFVDFQSLDKPEGNKRFMDIFAVEFNGAGGTPVLNREGLRGLWDREGGRQANNNQRRQEMVYVRKDQPQSAAQAVNSSAVVNNIEEVKEESKQVQDDSKCEQDKTVRLCHDKEWIAILQLAQEQIPLSFNAPSHAFPLLSREAVEAKMAELETQDFAIVYDQATTYFRDYQRVHPQTKSFIERFGLDDRLFQPRQRQEGGDAYNGQNSFAQKRTFTEANIGGQAEPKSTERPQQAESLVQAAAQASVTKDENEIDLDDI